MIFHEYFIVNYQLVFIQLREFIILSVCYGIFPHPLCQIVLWTYQLRKQFVWLDCVRKSGQVIVNPQTQINIKSFIAYFEGGVMFGNDLLRSLGNFSTLENIVYDWNFWEMFLR